MTRPASRAIAVVILFLLISAFVLIGYRQDPAGNPDGIGIEIDDNFEEAER